MSTLDGCCTCLLFALVYLMVPKFRRLKHLHLTFIVLKVSSVAPPNSFFKKLNLIPISYWLELKDIVFFFNCKVGLYDLDIGQFIKQPQHQSTCSSSGDFLRPNVCRTTVFRNSYFDRIVIMWNNLPSDIKSSSSISILKANLYKYYNNKLNAAFNTDRPRTWKTL